MNVYNVEDVSQHVQHKQLNKIFNNGDLIMKRKKKILAIGIIAAVIVSTAITAFAASSYSRPAEIVSKLTGRTTEDVIEEKKEDQKSFCEIANEAGKLYEFQEKN